MKFYFILFIDYGSFIYVKATKVDYWLKLWMKKFKYIKGCLLFKKSMQVIFLKNLRQKSCNLIVTPIEKRLKLENDKSSG